MRYLLGLITMFALGCVSSTGGPNDPPNDPNDPPNDPPKTETCLGGNNCVCPQIGECNHTCSEGAIECHVQGANAPVDVTCNENVECHVECSAASSCDVECGGSSQCHVTCPESGCTVTNCVGDCEVSCGLNGAATITGTTARCP